jgi:hypothetical protein
MYRPTLSLTSVVDGGGLSTPPPGHFTPGKDPVPIALEAGWAPGPVWMGAEILAFTGIRSPDRPARSRLLYQLSYQSHPHHKGDDLIIYDIVTSHNLAVTLRKVYHLVLTNPILFSLSVLNLNPS